MTSGYRGDKPLAGEDTPDQGAPTTDATRRSMQGNRGRDTRPEMAVRRLLHASGLRYRVAYRPLPPLRRTADIVFTRARIAVFIDGCFWHRCPRHASIPRARTEFWTAKFDRNVARDADTNTALEAAGWLVLRFWEHEQPKAVADRIRNCVAARYSTVQ